MSSSVSSRKHTRHCTITVYTLPRKSCLAVLSPFLPTRRLRVLPITSGLLMSSLRYLMLLLWILGLVILSISERVLLIRNTMMVILMAVIEITTIFGKVIAKPMRLVDIHDVQPMADEESINNSDSNRDKQEESKVAEESCCELANASPAPDPEQ